MSRSKTRPFRPSPKFAAAPAAPVTKRVAEPRPAGVLPAEYVPLMLTVEPGRDYALIDSGDGEKLERHGPLVIRRPEGQALWRPALDASLWAKADAAFTGDTD
ncbi:MAG: class I SAM-dependent rRNA methyltransferase, partial [Rhizobiaceae bacterium]|nr:class I SAM-dependent rRNA methyltransferase [Rhizobiaceae bacterium]